LHFWCGHNYGHSVIQVLQKLEVWDKEPVVEERRGMHGSATL
jgi:hypothetical protein